MTPDLIAFVTESNRIEGIHRPPIDAELRATEMFLALGGPSIDDLRGLVSVLQPRAILREKPGLNVRVGDHIAPEGGPKIKDQLSELLSQIRTNNQSPWTLHNLYETLHPFTDGNGRSGRALWAWQMLRFDYWPGIKIGFLHCYYYQTLQEQRHPGVR